MTTPAVAGVVQPTTEGGEEFVKVYRKALSTVVALVGVALIAVVALVVAVAKK